MSCFDILDEFGQIGIFSSELRKSDLGVLDFLSKRSSSLFFTLELNNELIELLIGLHEGVILLPQVTEFSFQISIFSLN